MLPRNHSGRLNSQNVQGVSKSPPPKKQGSNVGEPSLEVKVSAKKKPRFFWPKAPKGEDHLPSIILPGVTVDGQNPANHHPDDDYPMIYRVSTIPGGAGFHPSTVC